MSDTLERWAWTLLLLGGVGILAYASAEILKTPAPWLAAFPLLLMVLVFTAIQGMWMGD